jgi:hypothetical protein
MTGAATTVDWVRSRVGFSGQAHRNWQKARAPARKAK